MGDGAGCICNIQSAVRGPEVVVDWPGWQRSVILEGVIMVER